MSLFSVKVGSGAAPSAGITVEVSVMESVRQGVCMSVDHVSERWYFPADVIKSVEIHTATNLLGDSQADSTETLRRRLTYAGEICRGELIREAR